MLRLSNLADYAVVVMTAAARAPAERQSAASIAAASGVPAPTAAKLMGLLSRAGLLESSRGVAGGFALARPADAISVADIVEAIDGPIALTQCIHVDGSDCAIEGRCQARAHWPVINAQVRAALADVSLARVLAAAAPIQMAEA